MSDSMVAKIAEIAGLSLPELRERWTTLYGSAAPAYSREHLIRRLAHRLQVLQFGGLSDATRSALRAIAEKEAPNGRVRPLVRRDANDGAPAVGTRFVRDWHGERHEVEVVADGFVYRGQVFRTLSAVAKKITNAHWSGALFFGLRTRRKERC
jgi:hypothetical protein